MSATTTLLKDPAAALQGHGLYIDGKRVSNTSGGKHRHVNPATGQVQAEVEVRCVRHTTSRVRPRTRGGAIRSRARR